MKLSIAIPAYEMKGKGAAFLRHSLDIIKKQTFKDFEVVVSDDSYSDKIQNLCSKYGFVKYVRNTGTRGIASNFNNAIKNCSGELIKMLCQDDFLVGKDALQKTIDSFSGHWLVSACEHSNDGKTFYRPFIPSYRQDIWKGFNTISSPSVVTILNKNPLLFDERLVMLTDCEYYKRIHDTFGMPVFLNDVTVANRTWKGQVSGSLSEEVIRQEVVLLSNQYDND